jgi:hypothetical protein
VARDPDRCDSRHSNERCLLPLRHRGECRSTRFAWRLLTSAPPTHFGPEPTAEDALAQGIAFALLEDTRSALVLAVSQRTAAYAWIRDALKAWEAREYDRYGEFLHRAGEWL